MYIKKIFLVLLFFYAMISLIKYTSAITVEISAVVPGCGNTIIDIGEQCDGLNLGGSSCSTLGFNTGTLSCSSACTFNTSMCTIPTPPSGGGGGGGGGGGTNVPDTNVVFSGRAYPLSRVSILKDGQLVVTTIAGPDSNFTATISGLSRGNYNFSVYGEDKNNLKSNPFVFPLFITPNVTTKIGGIFISPTIATDKSEVKKGDTIVIFGQSVPFSDLTIQINSDNQIFEKRKADANGAYLLNFDTSFLEYGEHTTKSKSVLAEQISDYSKTVGFLVSNKTVFADIPKSCPTKADLNNDCRVNLVDFSIAAFWYKKELSAEMILKEKEKLNGDKKINLVDFSIMAFHWTG